MIVIVEGVDRVGKTTLINNLVSGFGFKRNNAIEKWERDSSEITRIVETNRIFAFLSTIDLAYENGINLVFDRLHVSEYVYGLHSRCYNSKEAMQEFENILFERYRDQLVVVYVEPVDIMWSNLQHGSPLNNHQEEFRKWFESTRLEVIKVNYNNLNYALGSINTRLMEGLHGK